MEYTIGKNAVDNHKIILDSQTNNPNDVWFHLDELSSAHLIFHNTRNQSISQLLKRGIIYKFACILKKHCSTKLRKYEMDKINVIYCKVSDIKLGRKIGEVYAQKHNTIYV
jgi:hypothetical protein